VKLPPDYTIYINQFAPCSEKNRAKLFLSQLCQIFTNFDHF